MEVVAPSLSPVQAQRLIYSLSLGQVLPEVVTLVTNEVDNLDTHGLNVRLLRFNSDQYPIGYKDVVLRCNIGLFFSIEDKVMQTGEDHISSDSTIKEGQRLLQDNDFYFGHHRYIDIDALPIEELVVSSPSMGKSREHGVNRYHTFRSSYSGSFGYTKDKLIEAGGWDMAFMCRHAGEDQQLGRRIIGDNVFIHEPPFWWHPISNEGWGKPRLINVCEEHEFYIDKSFKKCYNCPFFKYIGNEEFLFQVRQPLLAFDPGKVEVTEKWI